MRENIGLFRGKRIDNSEWVEGAYIPPCSYNDYHYGTCIAINNEEGWLKDLEVDPDTIGECTELKDKNGKLIFEGDIVRVGGDRLPRWYEEGEFVKVEWEYCGWNPFAIYDDDCGQYLYAEDCEVVGNVTDNPELLKGGEG